MAELYQVSVKTVNEHLVNIYNEGELAPQATIRKFRIVQTEGARRVSRMVDHYNLDAILAVGYRVRSTRGTAFRRWATARLQEYIVKGFTLDEERLKGGKGVVDYFDELLACIREIRAGEARVCQRLIPLAGEQRGVRLHENTIQGAAHKDTHMTAISLLFMAVGDIQRLAFNFYDQGRYKD